MEVPGSQPLSQYESTLEWAKSRAGGRGAALAVTEGTWLAPLGVTCMVVDDGPHSLPVQPGQVLSGQLMSGPRPWNRARWRIERQSPDVLGTRVPASGPNFPLGSADPLVPQMRLRAKVGDGGLGHKERSLGGPLSSRLAQKSPWISFIYCDSM